MTFQPMATLLLALAAGGAFLPREAPKRVELDPFDRSIERLRYECYSTLGRREITLFANGTIRLRDGLKTSPTLALGELGRDELLVYLRRLQEVDLTEAEETTQGVGGEWVERCRLQLARPDDRDRVYSFGRLDTRGPAVDRLVRIAEDLATHVQPINRAQHLPTGYDPRPGDVLRRIDGQLFRVIGDTADKRGIELDGVIAPLRVFAPKGGLNLDFDALVSRVDRLGKDRPYEGER